MIDNLRDQLRRDEGVKPSVYQDHLGFWTIGVGRLVDARKGGALRPAEIDYLLANDIEDRAHELTRRLTWFAELDEVRQGVLLNMAFQLGTAGLLGFSTMLKHVKDRRWADAATAMLDSRWAVQTPARAARLAKQMQEGAWQ